MKKKRQLFETPGWKVQDTTIKKPAKKRKRPPTDIRSRQEAKAAAVAEAVGTAAAKVAKETTTTPLSQALHKSGLLGSRFRILNESLYTSTGADALQLFQSSQDDESHHGGNNFQAYHDGFRAQTEHWPQNPVELIAQDLLQQQQGQGTSWQRQRKPQVLLVADLGCGEAPLAKRLCGTQQQQNQEDCPFRVFSYDLMADSQGWITVAECASRVPLPGSLDDTIHGAPAMMDVVVCCLSLMSTNWVGFLLEARRILKLHGILRIAEVTSRFKDLSRFIQFVTSLGFSLSSKPVYNSIHPSDESNSHFILFKFTKTNLPPSETRKLIDAKTKQALIQTGPELLKPCIYKRR
ncbi:hypothetical protein VP01_3947g1 [Puccinia sorghi]|uniref:Ribosomal RNA-processing protein 8 n=1 Tax=Puccinia sorghi TaxID=27349 RepID=A0A0L6USE2_9BASI|nr:hypothetical protein VP01_3947g1 [Puccinia sorghi]